MKIKQVSCKLALFLLAMMLLASGCQNSLPSSSTYSRGVLSQALPPTIQLETTQCKIKADMIVLPFQEAVEEAGLIAKVSINNVVEELSEPSPKTLYEASVISVLKGDKELTTVHILQNGNSDCSFNDNDLFMPDEQYYLILNYATGAQLEHTYYIQGEETGIYKILDDEYIMKLAYRDSFLSDINDAALTGKLQASYIKQIMVLNEQLFVNKISNLLNE